jgi:hypothetical protein
MPLGIVMLMAGAEDKMMMHNNDTRRQNQQT